MGSLTKVLPNQEYLSTITSAAEAGEFLTKEFDRGGVPTLFLGLRSLINAQCGNLTAYSRRYGFQHSYLWRRLRGEAPGVVTLRKILKPLGLKIVIVADPDWQGEEES